MKKSIYTLRDKLTGYMTPSLDDNDQAAMRNLKHAINLDPTLTFHAKPTDFSLCKLGTFDTDTGVITPIDIEIVCELSDLLVKEI